MTFFEIIEYSKFLQICLPLFNSRNFCTNFVLVIKKCYTQEEIFEIVKTWWSMTGPPSVWCVQEYKWCLHTICQSYDNHSIFYSGNSLGYLALSQLSVNNIFSLEIQAMVFIKKEAFPTKIDSYIVKEIQDTEVLFAKRYLQVMLCVGVLQLAFYSHWAAFCNYRYCWEIVRYNLHSIRIVLLLRIIHP